MSGGGASDYDASIGPSASSMGATPSSSALKGLLGTLSDTGGSKSKQATTSDLIKMGLQMMQRPQQQIQPQQFSPMTPMTGGMPQAPGLGQIPMAGQQTQQPVSPMTQFPRF